MAYVKKSEEIDTESRICKLRKSIIHRIMECLPLIDAARMSVLSSKWREHWRTIPALLFDDQGRSYIYSIYDFVNKVLLQHKGPIVKFILKIPYTENVTTVSDLVLFVSTNELKEFTMIKSNNYPCAPLQLPSYIFTCSNLTKLKLGRCTFNLPRSFDGFQHLVSIDFEDMVCLELGSFLAKCPLLEKLTLRNINLGANASFKLDSNLPNLKYLTISGMLFDSISLDGCRGILSISISLQKFQGDNFLVCYNNGTKELFKFLDCYSQVECLSFNTHFIKFLVNGGAMGKLLYSSFIHVKDLRLTSIDSYDELSFALGIIRSCPYVERLHLSTTFSFEIEGATQSFIPFMHILYKFNKLRTINARLDIRSFVQLKVFWYLLGCAPMLEVINLEVYGKFNEHNKLAWSRKLRQFKEESSCIVIITSMARKEDNNEETPDQNSDTSTSHSESSGLDSDFSE